MVQTMQDMGELYRDTRERIAGLVLAPEVDDGRAVPACPQWTVKDVIAHLTGVCEDILAGNIADAPSDPWTAAQVERGKHVSLTELVERWAIAAAQVEPLTPMFPDRTANQWVADVVSHEHDLRAALGAPGARTSAALEVAVDFLAVAFLDNARRQDLAPPLEIVAGDRTWATEGASPQTRLSTDGFELMRALSGRRSVGQIRALDWSSDPEPFIRSFEWGPFRPNPEDLIE